MYTAYVYIFPVAICQLLFDPQVFDDDSQAQGALLIAFIYRIGTRKSLKEQDTYFQEVILLLEKLN